MDVYKKGEHTLTRRETKENTANRRCVRVVGILPGNVEASAVFGIIPYTAQAGSTMLVFSVASSVTIPRL